MIHAFKDSLKRLVVDPNDPFHIHVRERVGKKATDNLEMKLKEFILRMPSIVSRIEEIMRQEPEGSFASRLSQYLLIYLYDPEDFLPEKDKGLFGYLDDAYFVAIVYLLIIQRRTSEILDRKDIEFEESLFQFLGVVRYVIPDECKKIEKTISDIESNQILSYASNF